MHMRQPMQRSYSISTRPASSLYVAPVGHTFMHAGFSQCWQASGTYVRDRFGYVPTAPSMASQPSVSTRFHSMPSGTLFCILHAFAQVWQPMQRSRLIPIASLVMAYHLRFLHFNERVVKRDGRAGGQEGIARVHVIVRDVLRVSLLDVLAPASLPRAA